MIVAVALWGALLTAGWADEPDTDAETVTSRATDALQDAATLRPRVVRWRQQIQPGYPTEERTKGWPDQHCRGVFTLGADGVPLRVEVTECAAPFQAAATRALMDWRTYPLDVDAEGDVVMALVQVDFAVPGTPVAPHPAPVVPPTRTSTPPPVVASPPPSTRPSPTTPPPPIDERRLAQLRVEADALARDIAADKASFEAQVIESDWYGGERVAVVQWLLVQAASTETRDAAGAMFMLPDDRAELARKIGTSVGVLQRVLHLVDTLGGATVHGDVITVRDPQALGRLLGPAR
jgi:hypothetical protein